MLVVDAHHHFWDPAQFEYPWMAGDAMDPVRRPFGPADLADELGPAGVTGTVLVQTISDTAETRRFLDIAAGTDYVRGVVGWVDLTARSVGDELDALLDGPGGDRLVGIRHQVHDEADPRWLCRDDVRRGLSAVQSRGLAYDILVRARELPAATETVAALPELRFVLDHIAKPRIADGHDEPWRDRISALALRPNVSVKLSGMVTEADWANWTADDLRPFVGLVVDRFGVERVMFGSDWPVCLLAASYAEVVQAAETLTADLTPSEQNAIFGDTARRIYQL